MKYLLPFCIILLCGLAVFSFFQYRQINTLEEKLAATNEKLPKFAEAMSFLETKINQLERELALQKGFQKLQDNGQQPLANTVQPLPDPYQNQPLVTPSFKDMQPRQ